MFFAFFGIPYRLNTLLYSSNISYSYDIEIYKIFSNHPLNSLRKYFEVNEYLFYLETEYYNKIINNPHIIIFESKEDILDMNKYFINFDKFENIIVSDFFEFNKLGIVVVPFSGINYLKNAKIINNAENNFEFSIEIWTITKPLFAGIPRSAWDAIIFLKIPK
jgi:hypothetical protein